jgi:carnitine-CoA ligase
MHAKGIPSDMGRERTLQELLLRAADLHGAKTLIRVGNDSASFREMPEIVAAAAGRYAAAGIQFGDRIALFSSNRKELIELWLGAAWLGAIAVPINTALRGAQLQHVLRDSAVKLLIAEHELLPALASLEDVPYERAWILGEPADPTEAVAEPLPPLGPLASPAQSGSATPAAILYTSGTTGPAKGVVCPHGQWYRWGETTAKVLQIHKEDVLYTCLPLFHSNALNTFVQALLTGATFVPGPRFSASRFWQQLVDENASVTYLMGAMVGILAKRAEDTYEHAHNVRVALAPATPAALHEVFKTRFGIEIVDGWGSTETNFVLSTGGTTAPAGSLGQVIQGFEARIVNEQGREVSPGEKGELVVRAEDPYSFSLGYYGIASTSTGWDDGWFHTGDRVYRDTDGWYWFHDRIKESIRRRGENISSWDVETLLQAHADIESVAVVPVPSELGEDEVMAWVVPRDGVELSPERLVRYMDGKIAKFAIPRYFQIVSALPLTENGKVEKYRLREIGIGPQTWDREHDRARSSL